MPQKLVHLPIPTHSIKFWCSMIHKMHLAYVGKMSCGSTNPRQWVSRHYESLLTIILEIIWHTKNMLLKRSFKMKFLIGVWPVWHSILFFKITYLYYYIGDSHHVNGYHYFDHEIVTTTTKPNPGWHLNEWFSLNLSHGLKNNMCSHTLPNVSHIRDVAKLSCKKPKIWRFLSVEHEGNIGYGWWCKAANFPAISKVSNVYFCKNLGFV